MSAQKTLSAEQAIKLAKEAADKGNKQEAEKYYKAVLDKYPENQEAINGFKALNPNTLFRTDLKELQDLFYRKAFREVEVRSKMLLERYPNVMELCNLIGAALAEQGKVQEALPYFQEVLNKNSMNATAYYNLANTYRALGRVDDAVKHYTLALNLKPDYHGANNNLGTLYRALGLYDKALDCYIKIAKAFPNSLDVLINIAGTLMEKGDYQLALNHYQKIINLDNTIGIAYHDIALCHKHLGNYEVARQCFEALLKDKPESIDAHNNFGNLLFDIGEYDDAKSHYEEAIKLEPKASASYNNLGNLLWEIGELDNAHEYFSKAYELSPGRLEIIYNLANSLKDKGDYEGSRNIFEKGLELLPNGPVCLTSLGVLSFLLDDDKAAQNYFNKMNDSLVAEIKDHRKRQFCEAYKRFLTRLIDFNSKHKFKAKKAAEKLWIIGGSVSLSSKGHLVKVDGKDMTADAKWVAGAKAFHFSGNKNNKYKASVEHHLKELGKNTNVLFMFGTIDCRLDEGILKASKKSNKEVAEVVKETVTGYFDYTYKQATKNGIKPFYCGVPAPLIEEEHEDADALVTVIDEFNKELKALCDQNKLLFVDVHSYTRGKNGQADGSKHLDAHHLVPTALNEALNG